MISLKKWFSIKVKKHYTNALFLSSMLIFFNTTLTAQLATSKNAQQIAIKSIEQIEDKGLIVKLYTQQTTIDAMKEKMASNPKLKATYQKKLKSIISTRNQENEFLIKAFKKQYNFSKVYFIPDYNFKAFVNGESGSLFWNEDLEEVEISGLDGDFVVLSRNFGSRYDWKVCNKALEVVPNPFPNYFSMKPVVVQFFMGLFAPSALYKLEAYETLVKKMETKFIKFKKQKA